jgi:hypothetical protein
MRVGAEVWSLRWRDGEYFAHCEGRVTGVTAGGYVVGRKVFSFTACPLFVSRETAEQWAAENPWSVPGAPAEFGNVIRSDPKKR